MSRLKTLKFDELSNETQQALEKVKVNGKLADVYLEFANSESALLAYLRMEDSIRQGSLEIQEVEAVKLWLSEQTQCDYCLSIHSYKAGLAGLDEQIQQAIRSGHATGFERLDILLEVAATLFRTPGAISSDMVERARLLGVTDENFIDLTMVMSTIFFTNITNHINHSQSPLPPAKPV